jgi:hypothetical protein
MYQIGRPRVKKNLAHDLCFCVFRLEKAYAEQVSIGPESIAQLSVTPCGLLTDLSNQPNVVEVHRSYAAGNRAALGADANGNRVDIRQIHTRK